jgi:hypothetical protein
MVNTIREPIKVGVIFSANSIKPVWFMWKSSRYTVKQVTFAWRSREGSATIYHFAVTDGANLFELSFHTKTAEWILESIECEG